MCSILKPLVSLGFFFELIKENNVVRCNETNGLTNNIRNNLVINYYLLNM